MPTDTKRILVVDPQMAGVSGDMIVAALLDLGADHTKVIEAMKTPRHVLRGCNNLEIAVMDTVRHDIRAKKIDVIVEEDAVHRTAAELLDAASACLQRLQISEKAVEYALNSINTLVSAEAAIHGKSIEKVELHETGSADTLADVIGAATALDDLGLFADTAIYSTPVALGGALFQSSHGTVASPAPATLEILRSRGFLTIGGPAEAELATPTGVSLLTNLASESVRFYPPMVPTCNGYGAGTKEFAEMPNVLRVTLGEPCDFGLLRDEVYVIETNLDDVPGELIGHVMQKLLQEGVRDVTAIPTLTKKGRPGHLIEIIVDRLSLERVCRLLIEETGTLGVRIHGCERRILARQSIPVEVTVGDTRKVVRVKVARSTSGQVIQVKPEYDDIKRLADETGKPLREINEFVKRKAEEALDQH
jgi:uncharacterized protein (TIGR00299 family) protein